ncbi:unannotated protein [freshwater metagenome]|uniref:Unannotated protein n=1 Tax=freshwater metagenome TaxID=449393 RepID=A0A6J7NRZ9_9ZZZZ
MTYLQCHCRAETAVTRTCTPRVIALPEVIDAHDLRRGRGSLDQRPQADSECFGIRRLCILGIKPEHLHGAVWPKSAVPGHRVPTGLHRCSAHLLEQGPLVGRMNERRIRLRQGCEGIRGSAAKPRCEQLVGDILHRPDHSYRLAHRTPLDLCLLPHEANLTVREDDPMPDVIAQPLAERSLGPPHHLLAIGRVDGLEEMLVRRQVRRRLALEHRVNAARPPKIAGRHLEFPGTHPGEPRPLLQLRQFDTGQAKRVEMPDKANDRGHPSQKYARFIADWAPGDRHPVSGSMVKGDSSLKFDRSARLEAGREFLPRPIDIIRVEAGEDVKWFEAMQVAVHEPGPGVIGEQDPTRGVLAQDGWADHSRDRNCERIKQHHHPLAPQVTERRALMPRRE